MQQDRDGALWVSFSSGKGVYKLVQGAWTKLGTSHGIPDPLITTMSLDGEGNVWMGHLRSQITLAGPGPVRRLGPEQGLQLGTMLHLYFDGKTMWSGGENGVAVYRDGRFVTLHGERGERFRGVSGIVRLPGGDLWLNGADGLYRIAAADLGAWQKGGAGPVPFERFNAQDGMQGRAPQLRPVPSLRLSRDGALWYATTGSVGTVDPAHLSLIHI